MFGRKDNQEFTVSNRTILRVIGLVVLSIGAIQILERVLHPLTMIFVAFFLAMALNPAVVWVSSKLKIKSRIRATAIAYVVIVTVLITFFALVLPPLIRQTTDFVQDAPETLRELEDDEGTVGDLVRRYDLEEQVADFANTWSENIDTEAVVSTSNRVVSNLFSIITVLILTFMMLIEGPKWLAFLWKQYPEDHREHAQSLARRMYRVVTQYVNGQVLVAGIGATFAAIMLFITTNIFDVTSINPIAMGGVVFLFNLVPYIGVFLSSSVVILFSLFASIPLAITMLVFFVVYQQIENASIQPYIQSKGLELTPMLVFIAAIIGVSVSGILGALIAIPLAGCLRVLVEDYLERNTSYKARTKKT